MAVVYFSVGRQKKNSQGRVEIKGAPSNFSVLQLAGETAQHDLDLRHTQSLPVKERSDHAGSFSCLRCTNTPRIDVHGLGYYRRYSHYTVSQDKSEGPAGVGRVRARKLLIYRAVVLEAETKATRHLDQLMLYSSNS